MHLEAVLEPRSIVAHLEFLLRHGVYRHLSLIALIVEIERYGRTCDLYILRLPAKDHIRFQRVLLGYQRDWEWKFGGW